MKLPIQTAGRMLYAVPFAGFGVMHLTMSHIFVGMVPSFVPGGVVWVYVIGVAFLAGATALVTGKLAKQAAWGLAAVLLLFIVTIWIPRLFSSESGSVGPTLAGLFKDFGLLGAALMVAGNPEG